MSYVVRKITISMVQKLIRGLRENLDHLKSSKVEELLVDSVLLHSLETWLLSEGITYETKVVDKDRQ